MNIWERFDAMATSAEVKEARENIFEKIPAGRYTAEVISIEPAESRDGNPMVRYKFRDVNTNKLIRTASCLSTTARPDLTPVNIARELAFIESLTGVTLEFTSMGQLCEDIRNLTVGNTVTLEVTYKNENAKYPDFAVIPTVNDEALPFN